MNLEKNKTREPGIISFSRVSNYNDVLVGGVDEAGRGSVLGPLVVAGVSIKRKDLLRLRKAGVRDSKMLSVKARQRFFGQIIDLGEHICIFKSECSEVDQYVFSNLLNKLEAKAMANVIENISAARIYVDACDVNCTRYTECIECELDARARPRIFSLHHADRTNAAVSAASIIAKIIRDQEIQKIRTQYAEIGSGYPCDKKTMKFVSDWVAANDSAPYFARKSWKPLRDILQNHREKNVKFEDMTEGGLSLELNRSVSSMY
jgi:ribonuclease HII